RMMFLASTDQLGVAAVLMSLTRIRGREADAGEGRTERPNVGARDQARRLSADGPADAWWRAHPDAPGLRLDGTFSGDRRCREPAARQIIRARREGVILRPDGVSDFDRLNSRRHDNEVQLLGFDLLEFDGADLRQQPLE